MIISDDHHPSMPHISAVQMQEKISQALGKSFTGLGVVAFDADCEVELLILAGEVRDVLLCEQGQKLRLPGANWKEHLSPPKVGNLQLCKSSGRLLTLELARFETQAHEARPNVPVADLEKIFASLENNESATIVALEWPQAQARVLLSGGKLNIRRGIFIKNFQVAEDDPALGMIKSQQNVRCNLEIYRGELANEAWVAVHLNILFEFFCEHFLRQYGYLTGKVMVNSILNNAMVHSAQQGWEMTVTSGKLIDQTYFATIDETISAYTGMLALVEAQMKSIIGVNFLSMVKTQSVDALNVFYTGLNKLYGLNRP